MREAPSALFTLILTSMTSHGWIEDGYEMMLMPQSGRISGPYAMDSCRLQCPTDLVSAPRHYLGTTYTLYNEKRVYGNARA